MISRDTDQLYPLLKVEFLWKLKCSGLLSWYSSLALWRGSKWCATIDRKAQWVWLDNGFKEQRGLDTCLSFLEGRRDHLKWYPTITHCNSKRSTNQKTKVISKIRRISVHICRNYLFSLCSYSLRERFLSLGSFQGHLWYKHLEGDPSKHVRELES